MSNRRDTCVRTSPKFPEGYGDFKLVSSDNVNFHFPKFLLSYQSSVFEGMFTAGAYAAQQSNELRLTEDSNTLECLLQYIDPKKTPVPPAIDSAKPLLEACRKYDIPTVAQQWEGQLILKWKLDPTLDEAVSLPMECLAIASQFDLDLLARFALRELTKAPITQLSTDISFDSRIFVHLMKLRADRLDWFERKFAAFFATIRAMSCNLLDFHNAMHMRVIEVIRQLSHEPSWKTIQKNLSLWAPHCGHYQTSEGLFNSWKAEIAELEATLPDLPSRR